MTFLLTDAGQERTPWEVRSPRCLKPCDCASMKCPLAHPDWDSAVLDRRWMGSGIEGYCMGGSGETGSGVGTRC